MNDETHIPYKHASDTYTDLIKPCDEPTTEPAIPAAAVVLLRDGTSGSGYAKVQKATFTEDPPSIPHPKKDISFI